MTTAIEWTTSILTIAVFYLMGNKWKYAPLLGIITQIFWTIFAIQNQAWGILLATVFILGVHIRNSYKWIRRENN